MATCQESALTTPSCQCYAKGFDGVSQIGSKIPPRLLCIDDFLAIKTCLYTRGVVVSTHLAEDRQTAMDSSVMRMDVHRSSCRNRHANAPPMPIANWSSRVSPRAQDFQHEIWPTYSSATHQMWRHALVSGRGLVLGTPCRPAQASTWLHNQSYAFHASAGSMTSQFHTRQRSHRALRSCLWEVKLANTPPCRLFWPGYEPWPRGNSGSDLASLVRSSLSLSMRRRQACQVLPRQCS